MEKLTSENKRILIVDDEEEIRKALAKILEREGYEILQASDGSSALQIIRDQRVNVVLADLRMPGMNGMELLQSIKIMRPEIEVIIITGKGTIEDAVECLKKGAYDFITKPFKRVNIIKSITKALDNQKLFIENKQLKDMLEGLRHYRRIIGTSASMMEVMKTVEQVSQSSATVLIQGESGTGKELVAEAIHYMSPRKNKPLIKVSCAALPETLLEAELFGFEKGAFTGAISRKEGRFELADGGTLFLDEVAEMTPSTQVKLLRVLQDGEFERLGGVKTLKVDVRIIAASNSDLLQAVKNKTFREDLYYRLNVITITLPPLRDRMEDVPLLVEYFIQKFSERNKKEIAGISKQAMDALMKYSWPGNVRELENTIERAVVFCKGKYITLEDLPSNIVSSLESRTFISIPIGLPLKEVEKIVVKEALRYSKGDKNIAARLLGIAPRTIYRKIERISDDSRSGGGDEN